ADPANQLIYMSYISRNAAGSKPDKVLIYNWALDEATFSDIPVIGFVPWRTQGYTQDTINSFGTQDTIPVSYDSPFWRGGAPTLGVLTSDKKLSLYEGASVEATFETADGRQPQRHFIDGLEPLVDSGLVEGAVAMRERPGEVVTYPPYQQMERNGIIPQRASGRIGRARLRIPAQAIWTKLTGNDVRAYEDGYS
ncbi:MAG: hypothetical protein AAGF32_10830, partial [Pseudomonadota bacterium]